MTGCSADYCTNSSIKGFQMCRFPREAKRRKVWIDNMHRTGWVPGPSSCLCHMHFSEEMWEKTRNGKRRLKSSAMPTMFGMPANMLQGRNESIIIQPMVDGERSTVAEQAEQESSTPNNETVYNEVLQTQESHSEVQERTELAKNTKTTAWKHLEGRLSKLEKSYDEAEKSKIKLKKQLYAANRRIKQLEQEVCSNKLKESIGHILNEDQINLLSNRYKKIPRWCNETLMNAYKLRFACGTSGYEELLQQNFPLPSIRTLTRKLENVKFASGAPIYEVFEFLKIKIAHFENDMYKNCIIVLDEMSITPGSFYDTSTNMYVGNVTLPGHDYTQAATHALVIMLAGL